MKRNQSYQPEYGKVGRDPDSSGLRPCRSQQSYLDRSRGTVFYWNAFVANLEMQGKGTFFDPRLSNVTQVPRAATQIPIAVAKALGNLRNEPDLVSPKLPALHYYQLSIPAPKPPPGSFNEEAADRGDQMFSGKAKCSTCHVEPTGASLAGISIRRKE